MEEVKLNEDEKVCLKVLADMYSYNDELYYAFKYIADDAFYNTKDEKYKDVKLIRRAVRSLKRKGLARFAKGLWGENGVGGAGYQATEEGFELGSKMQKTLF